MQISKINTIPIINKSVNFCQNFRLGMYSLSPIKTDEISFGARAKLLAESMSDAPRGKDCISVNINAEPSRYYLQAVLDKYISQFVKSDISDKQNSHKPIKEFYTRVKSPNSIREKVVSKFAKINREDIDSFCTIAIDQLLDNFNTRKNVNRKDLIAKAKKIFDYYPCKIPPFENTVYFFNQIISIFDADEVFDTSKISSAKLKSIYSSIIRRIDANAKYKHADKNGCYINPQSISGIKHYANDIVGARIIMSDSDPNDTAIILEAIRRASDDGLIKINSVESNIPDPRKLPKNKTLEDYEYATHNQLCTFANDTNAAFEENMSKTGYLAIHINLELTDPILSLYKGEYKGFSAEIQIIGSDVEKLKEVEDLCYKLKDNKNAIHSAYLPFKNHFLKYYKNEVKKSFEDYTYALYLAQRALPYSESEKNDFPSIKDLGFEGKVPPELDFNVLKKIKDDCDKEYKRLQKIEEDSNNNITCETLNRIKKSGDISTIKNMIDCKIR